MALEKRISAEQLFWSIGVVSGEFEAVRLELQTADASANDANETEANSETPETPETRADDDPRSSDIPRTAEQLVKNSETLTTLQKQLQSVFGNPPKEPEVDFTPTVAGALFLMHSEDFRRLLIPRPGNLINRLSELKSHEEIIDELFLCVLSRRPDSKERVDVANYLKINDDRKTERLANLTWALLTSTEFMVNH